MSADSRKPTTKCVSCLIKVNLELHKKFKLSFILPIFHSLIKFTKFLKISAIHMDVYTVTTGHVSDYYIIKFHTFMCICWCF